MTRGQGWRGRQLGMSHTHAPLGRLLAAASAVMHLLPLLLLSPSRVAQQEGRHHGQLPLLTVDSTPVSVLLVAAHDSTLATTSSGAPDSAGAAAATTLTAIVKRRFEPPRTPLNRRGTWGPPRLASRLLRGAGCWTASC